MHCKRERERQSDRERERETDRQTDRDREKQQRDGDRELCILRGTSMEEKIAEARSLSY